MSSDYKQPHVEVSQQVYFRDVFGQPDRKFAMYVTSVAEDYVRGIVHTDRGAFMVQRAFHVTSPQLTPAQYVRGNSGSWEHNSTTKRIEMLEREMLDVKQLVAHLQNSNVAQLHLQAAIESPLDESGDRAAREAQAREMIKLLLVKGCEDLAGEKMNIARATGLNHNIVAKLIRESTVEQLAG